MLSLDTASILDPVARNYIDAASRSRVLKEQQLRLELAKRVNLPFAFADGARSPTQQDVTENLKYWGSATKDILNIQGNMAYLSPERDANIKSLRNLDEIHRKAVNAKPNASWYSVNKDTILYPWLVVTTFFRRKQSEQKVNQTFYEATLERIRNLTRPVPLEEAVARRPERIAAPQRFALLTAHWPSFLRLGF